MKKISLYVMSFLTALAFVACDENFDDWADPQMNPQEDAIDVVFGATNATATIFDLNTISTETVEIAKVSLNNEEGTTTAFDVHFSATEDFAKKEVCELMAEGDGVKILTTDLQEAVVALYGKRPDERNLFMRVNGYVTTAKGQTLLTRSNNLEIKVTPIAPIIESAYYITGELAGDWGPAHLVKFNHSGKDVYEDPLFTITLECPKDKANFKIVPQSATEEGADFWGLTLGTAEDGDSSLEGTLVQNAGAIQIAEAGWVKITLDMMSYTYTIEPLQVSPYLWVPGNHQGWNPAGAPQVYTTNMDLVYNGHMYLDGGFKFTGQPAWGPTEYAYGYFGSHSENISDDGGNLVVAAGYYFVEVNLNTQDVKITETQWGLIGDATEGGWDASTPMTYDRGSDTWSVTTTLVGGKAFKFRANNGWDINMGGSTDKLLFDKGNIDVAESGTYKIVLHLGNDDNSYCTLTKQ